MLMLQWEAPRTQGPPIIVSLLASAVLYTDLFCQCQFEFHLLKDKSVEGNVIFLMAYLNLSWFLWGLPRILVPHIFFSLAIFYTFFAPSIQPSLTELPDLMHWLLDQSRKEDGLKYRVFFYIFINIYNYNSLFSLNSEFKWFYRPLSVLLKL